MNEGILTELIRNAAAIIMALGVLTANIGVILIGRWAYKAKNLGESAVAQSQSNAATLETVSTNVNGMKSDLVAATKAAANATGRLQGRDEERAYAEAEPVKVVIENRTGE